MPFKSKIMKKKSVAFGLASIGLHPTYKVSKLTRVARAARSPVTPFQGPHVLHVLSLPMSSTVSDVSLPRAAGIGPFNPTWVKFLNEDHDAVIC